MLFILHYACSFTGKGKKEKAPRKKSPLRTSVICSLPGDVTVLESLSGYHFLPWAQIGP